MGLLKTLRSTFGNPVEKKARVSQRPPRMWDEPKQESRLESPQEMPERQRASLLMKSKGYLRNAAAWTWRQIVNKPIEVVLMGAIGLGIGFREGYFHELKRDIAIPVSFSEITQLEDQAKSEGKPLGELTYFYAALNDGLNNIIQCRNWSYTLNGVDAVAFAKNLKQEMDPASKKHHYNLADFIATFESEGSSEVYIPKRASAALKKINDLTLVMNTVPSVASQFSSVWEDSHTDNTHLAPLLHTSTDGKGHVSTSISFESVYDNTTHSYTYHPDIGESASGSLDDLVSKVPSVATERLVPAKEVQKGNRDAILYSRIPRDPNIQLTEADYAKAAANWADGSTYANNIQEITGVYSSLVSGADAWRTEKGNSQSFTTTIPTRTPPDPKGFTICKQVVKDCKEIAQKIRTVHDSIATTLDEIPKLERKIYNLIQMPPERLKGKEGLKTAEEILASTESIYHANYERGYGVSGFRSAAVAAFSLIGLLAGAGVGFALDRAISAKWGENTHGLRYVPRMPKFVRKYV